MIQIIIDGYNLIFQCGFHPKNLDSALALHHARQRLLDELADRIEEPNRPKVNVVFDANTPKGESTPELNRKGFKVAFARDHDDADAMIIEMIRTHSQPRRLTVASNDHRIQTAASRRGAEAIDADVWFDGLSLLPQQDAVNSAAANDAKRPLLSDIETQKLIEEFTADQPCEDNQTNPLYNPFPDGYGDDLVD